MKWFFLGYALMPILLFFIWYRRPAGRSTSDPGLPDIKGLKEFDAANPDASEDLRRSFFEAVQAHLRNDPSRALRGYLEVLDKIPEERITLHNLNLLEE